MLVPSAPMFTYVDVIERAIQIIQGSNPPYSWSIHGECCCWCAVATAKSRLDEEHSTGVSFSKALKDHVYGEIEEVPSDEPLMFARKALEKWNNADPYMTREQAIEILLQAKSVVVMDKL